jgi:hypothetical protein
MSELEFEHQKLEAVLESRELKLKFMTLQITFMQGISQLHKEALNKAQKFYQIAEVLKQKENEESDWMI